ncbi:MAG: hypothetical protein WDN23_15605 [Edaphobacter sp.]
MREDAYDLIGRSGDQDGFADDGCITREEGLPETVADDGDLLASYDRLFGEEVAAEGGLDAEDVEEVGLTDDSADVMRMVIGTKAYSGGALPEEGHIGEGGGLATPDVLVACVGSGVGEEFVEEANLLPDDDEVAAVAVGEGLEEDGVDDGEESGGGSDAQRESEDGGECEGRGFAQLAQAVAEILQDGVHRFTSLDCLNFVLASTGPLAAVGWWVICWDFKGFL